MSGGGSLAGRVALVTGAGRGLGRAIAEALGGAGAPVALVARSAEQLEQAAAALTAAGGQALALPADVTDVGAPAQVVARVEAELGPLDILVHAAGVSPTYSRAEHHPIADWDAVMATNLRAAFLFSQAAGVRMLERRRGAIVYVASIGGLVALPRMAAYCAAKAGLVELARVLAVEWADRGVRVNAVAPGFVVTEMTRGLLAHEVFGPRLLAQAPLGRWAEPEDVASAVHYLVSDEARYVTGHTLVVDGGWTAQ